MILCSKLLIYVDLLFYAALSITCATEELFHCVILYSQGTFAAATFKMHIFMAKYQFKFLNENTQFSCIFSYTNFSYSFLPAIHRQKMYIINSLLVDSNLFFYFFFRFVRISQHKQIKFQRKRFFSCFSV